MSVATISAPPLRGSEVPGAKLVAALAGRLPPPVQSIETHLSWVLLAGEHAVKLKKPVKLPFADFSTLDLRRRACEEELRLNRRTAPGLYEAVVPITGTLEEPTLGGYGPPLEWAVLMHRFDQEALFDRMAAARTLRPEHVDDLATVTAGLHAGAPRAATGSPFGTHAEIRAEAAGNFAALLDPDLGLVNDPRLSRLHTWTLRAADRLRETFARRLAEGFVRECHGDLHLANVALLDGRAVPFDAIEFNELFRWIDVMSEAAFPAMDLASRGLPALSHRFVDAYLARTGDYGGVAVLRYYLAHRALVRAKVAAIHGHAQGVDAATRADRDRVVCRHLDLAANVIEPGRPALIVMQGLSGSGKTAISQVLLEAIGAIRIRSDVERKRLFGLSASDRSHSAPGAGLYTPEADARTQERLVEAAGQVLAARHVAIVDATNHKRESRERLARLARERDVPFAIVACEAPDAVLRERVGRRNTEGLDASEADLAVLDRQIAQAEPLYGEGLDHVVIVDGVEGLKRPDRMVLQVLRQVA